MRGEMKTELNIVSLRPRESRVLRRPKDGPRDGTDAVLLAALVVRDNPVRVSTELEIVGHLEVLLAHHAVTANGIV